MNGKSINPKHFSVSNPRAMYYQVSSSPNLFLVKIPGSHWILEGKNNGLKIDSSTAKSILSGNLVERVLAKSHRGTMLEEFLETYTLKSLSI